MKKALRQTLAVILTLVMTLTFIPFAGLTVSAGDTPKSTPKHKVTFYSESLLYYEKEYAEGDVIPEPEDPSDSVGHYFFGWSTVEGSEDNVVTFPVTMGTEQMTLYAVWSYSAVYKATFTDEYSETFAVVRFRVGERFQIGIPEVKKTGYVFSYWNVIEWESVISRWDYTFSAQDGGNLTIVAVYDPGEFTVTIDLNGGNFPDGYTYGNTITLTYNDPIVAPSFIPVKQGYTFKGWSRTKDATVPDTRLGRVPGDNNTVIYAVWEAREYNVTLYANNGTADSKSLPATAAGPFSPECTFTNGDLNFCGWYKDADCTVPWTSGDTVTENTVLYAGWTDLERFDTVTFGSYEQDNDLTDGKEPVEWIVLDPATGLSVSKYALDASVYNPDGTYGSSYKTSYVRSWLLNNFGSKAFTAQERALLKTNDVVTYKAGSDTEVDCTLQDDVFLLSVQEAKRFFDPYTTGACNLTAYAKANGGRPGPAGGCWWWLRTFGTDDYCAAGVITDGTVDAGGYYCNAEENGIRPAVYLDLKSGSVIRSIAGCSFDEIPDRTYTGGVLCPAVTVKDGNKTLVSGTDYVLSYADNVSAGTAKVTVTGIKAYSGSVTKTFKVVPRHITGVNIALSDSSFPYTGSEIKPAVTVTYLNSTVLTENKDYTVSYKNNVNAGTATVTVKGMGNFTEETSAGFTITPVRHSAPVLLSKTDETKCSASDGKISGVSTEMEYAFERGAYKACKGTEITGLAPGTYHVRYAADDNHYASDAVQLVIGKGACWGGEATCTAKGKCRGCGTEYIETDPANHVNTKEFPEQPATCTENGFTAGVYCNDCGKWISGRETIPAGHRFSAPVPAQDSTCTAEGHDAYYTCDGCGKYFDENKTEISGIPYRELAPHADNDGDGRCDDCGEQLKSECMLLTLLKGFIKAVIASVTAFLLQL